MVKILVNLRNSVVEHLSQLKGWMLYLIMGICFVQLIITGWLVYSYNTQTRLESATKCWVRVLDEAIRKPISATEQHRLRQEASICAQKRIP